ncbi:uncharacterized protein EDB93DRAFT_1257140 [Suillus bovinus]|uniref:uncharacterized protein n=1 Tax=Suillus bovinus TaxID=48563 RepID=UPI001B87469D|nr:uncharacterized protein EDB93DRAFT_1257140 [Suillus bovinus]KAG2127188.1 hypothetical protein EDB93DRAFT_1257140 [Suillus bovinus]
MEKRCREQTTWSSESRENFHAAFHHKREQRVFLISGALRNRDKDLNLISRGGLLVAIGEVELKLEGMTVGRRQLLYHNGTLAEFHDGFNKIAETGKRTLSSIVSKVKAKIQEYDQGQASRQNTQPTWGQTSQPPWGGVQPTQHQESYYDPNPPGESGIRGSGWADSVPTLAPSPTYVPPNFATKPIANSTSVATNSPTYTGSLTYSPPNTGMGMSPPPELARQSSDTSRLPSTGIGAPSGIDAIKFGLLPKRPVSLLREQVPPTHRDDNDDELEYTENPFEDR